MNKPHIDDNQEEKAQEQEKEQEKSFLLDLSSFFDSVATMLAGLGGDRDPVPPIQEAHTIRPLKKRTDLVSGAASCRVHLSRLKEDLIGEFGASCSQFITKSIDPMLRHIDEIIARLNGSDYSLSLEEEAIRSVGLYSEFRDEEKLRQKIISESQRSCQEAIEKDCQILLNYQRQAERSHPHIEEKLLVAHLEPIFQAFHKLHQTFFEGANIRDFFVWKSAIDEQRLELNETGFQIIDSYFSPPAGESVTRRIGDSDDEPHEAEYYS